jgi:hypothetical protein
MANAKNGERRKERAQKMANARKGPACHDMPGLFLRCPLFLIARRAFD